MKTFLVFLVLATLGGSAIGWYSSASVYVWPEARFGPFSVQSDLAPEELDEYFAEVRPTTFPELEVVGGTEYDFGVMLRGAEGSGEFEIRNVGDADLELEVTGSTCKCTVGKLSNHVLAPGESTKVQMSWAVKTSGDDFGQSANLRTNDPKHAELKLQVAGKVVDPLDSVPDVWNIGEAASGETLELTSTVYNRYDHDVEFVEAHWAQQALEELAEVEVVSRPVLATEDDVEHHQARQAFEVTATIPPGLSQGRLNGTLRLTFGHPPEVEKEVEDIRLTLVGRIVGPISLLGGPRLSGHEGGRYVFDMKSVGRGEGRTDKVYVVFRGQTGTDAGLKVANVEPASVLSAALGDPVDQGAFARYPLELTIKKDAPAGERLGKNKDDYGIVTIESESKEIAPLHLRVKYSVGRPPENR